MSAIKSFARLVAVCPKERLSSFDKRQIPIHIDDNLIMKLQVEDLCLARSQQRWNKTEKSYQIFLQAFTKLTAEELEEALCVSLSQIKECIRHCLPCIGCRTSIENFMKSSAEHQQHPGLEPLVMNEKGSITLRKACLSNRDDLYALFYIHGSKLHSFVENIPKSKKNRRCNIHLLDKFKSISDWEIVWDMMNKECREEITLVEVDGLLDTLENYLRKHKFCVECKLKVLEAFDLLIGDGDYKQHEKKGFCPALYEGLQSCTNDKHIHVDPKKGFLSTLICRAEPDIHDSRRERHAKTLDIAQEEILTCIGIYLFERFDKIYRTMRSEEQTWQLLFYIAVDCLRLNFEKAVDRKQDFDATLRILCEELCESDVIKTQKKPGKRSKRKPRREVKAIENTSNQIDEQTMLWNESDVNKHEEGEEGFLRRRTSDHCSCVCHDCLQRSNSLSTSSTGLSLVSLVKSQSCPSSLLLTSDSASKPSYCGIHEHALPISNSLETLLSSISIRECVCHERSLGEKQLSCTECHSSSSISCMRCSTSTRNDLGYSSGQDDTSSFGLCDCSLAACDACLSELLQPCPLYEEDESGISVSPTHSILSSSVCSEHEQASDPVTDHSRTIELCDTTGKHTLKLQLSDEYPFFIMDLKQAWDEVPSSNSADEMFISDADLSHVSMLNQNVDVKRAQLRETFKLNFQAWQRRWPYKT